MQSAVSIRMVKPSRLAISIAVEEHKTETREKIQLDNQRLRMRLRSAGTRRPALGAYAQNQVKTMITRASSTLALNIKDEGSTNVLSDHPVFQKMDMEPVDSEKLLHNTQLKGMLKEHLLQ